MKKTIYTLIIALAVAALLPTTAFADSGPKPSVVVDFEGMEGETYYVTLLSKSESTGPYSAVSPDELQYAHSQPGDEDHEIFLKFLDYKDPDGFYFIQFFQNCSQSQEFRWGYYPPREFKVLVYFPETDDFISSTESLRRYAFDSYFTARVSDKEFDGEEMSIEKSYSYSHEIISLFVRILLTLAIELGIALLFSIRERKLFRFIVIVNIITQVALNVTLNIINYQAGRFMFIIFYVLLELAVFILEALLYTAYLKRRAPTPIPVGRAVGYAFAANAASFILGMGLAYVIPGIF